MQWKLGMDLSEIYTDYRDVDFYEDTDKVKELSRRISEKIKTFEYYKSESALHSIVESFENDGDYLDDIDEYDEILDELYDWGDIPTILDGTTVKEKKCWINTY